MNICISFCACNGLLKMQLTFHISFLTSMFQLIDEEIHDILRVHICVYECVYMNVFVCVHLYVNRKMTQNNNNLQPL